MQVISLLLVLLSIVDLGVGINEIARRQQTALVVIVSPIILLVSFVR